MIPSIVVSWGEFFDRKSILKLKTEKMIGEKQQIAMKELKNLVETENIYTQWNYLPKEDKNLIFLEEKLYEINSKLWHIEDSLRILDKARKFGEQFINYARSVYKYNDERHKIKREIDKLLKSSIIEVKSYE